MALALTLAARGLGQVWPNPAVGCVIVKAGRIVGRGWTQPGGRPHGETMALAQAGVAADGATAYVSLEPCAHHGKTPPCAEALIAAGITRVVSAHEDPDARVSGKGHAMLRAAGITVECGLMEAEARSLQRGFLSRISKGRPMVTLKLATSLDGRIATASGESQWITGPQARRLVHHLRARHDGVMVGAGTARADDPTLTVRDMGVARQPVRIVVSRRLDLPLDGKLAQTARDVPLWLIQHDAPAERAAAFGALGATVIPCPLAGDQPDMAHALQALGRAGLTRILVEGGGQLAAALLAAGLVDEVILFTAGLTLGNDARAGLGNLGLAHLADAQRFELIRVDQIGPDSVSYWRV